MLVEFRGVLGSSTLPDNIAGEIGSTRGAVKSSGFCFAFARSGVAVKISTENECLGLRKTCSALDWSLECISPSGPSSGTPSKLSDMEIPRLCLPSKSPRTEEFFFWKPALPDLIAPSGEVAAEPPTTCAFASATCGGTESTLVLVPSYANGKNARTSAGTPPLTPAASDPCNNLCNISGFTFLCLAAFIKACPCARNISAAELNGDISTTLVKAISDRGQKLGNAFFVAKVNRRLPLDRKSL